jgi:hypothetical protein
MCRDAV